MTGIKVRILITGLWAINPPNPGELHISEGEERDDIPQQLIDRMLNADSGPCVEILKDVPVDSPEEPDDPETEEETTDDVSGIRATLMEIADNTSNKNEAKSKIEELARVTLDYEVDKRRSLDNIIADVIAEYEK